MLCSVLLHLPHTQVKLQLSFFSQSTPGRTCVVEAMMTPGPTRQQRPAITNLAAVLKTIHVRGEGRSNQQARQQACADMLELLLQVGSLRHTSLVNHALFR